MSHKIDWTTLPILYGDAQFSSDQSSTSEQTLIQRDISAPTTVRMMIQGFSVVKTSANTSALRIYIDGESMSDSYTTGTTNSTAPSPQIVCGWATLSPGTHTISLRLRPQDTLTTGTVCAYRRSYLIGWCV